VIGHCDLDDEAIYCADLNARPLPPRPCSEYGTGGVGMGQDEQAVLASRCDLACILGPLMGLAASGWCLDDDQQAVGSQRGVYCIIAQSWKSAISGGSTAIRMALQNGSRCGFNFCQAPKLNTFSAPAFEGLKPVLRLFPQGFFSIWHSARPYSPCVSKCLRPQATTTAR
jgi:hypothetical protein